VGPGKNYSGVNIDSGTQDAMMASAGAPGGEDKPLEKNKQLIRSN
jgi:hypothetical protein